MTYTTGLKSTSLSNCSCFRLLLLTGIELFADFDVQMAWKNAGAPYTGDPRYEGFDDLNTFAHTTQKIRLCLESGGNWFWRLSERVEFCGGQAARSRVSSAIS